MYCLPYDVCLAFVSRSAILIIITESPQGGDSESHHHHHHFCWRRECGKSCHALEGSCLNMSLHVSLAKDSPIPCLSWRNTSPLLPKRRRNGIFENSLHDHSSTPLSALMVLRLWGNESGSQWVPQPSAGAAHHTLDSWEIPREKYLTWPFHYYLLWVELCTPKRHVAVLTLRM